MSPSPSRSSDPAFGESLTRGEAERILAWLGVAPAAPTRAWVDSLLAAYVQRVPWESASRMARRASSPTPADAVAWPQQFWHGAMTRGTGGTCFESNAAVAALLAGVGIASTLTLNDRPPIPACHTALIVDADGERLVVDAGFPLHASVPLPVSDELRDVRTPWGTLTSRRSSADARRIVIGQHPHPVPVAFELVDEAVAPGAYAAATCADYGDGGLFLDVVVIKKVVEGDIWRFTSADRPWSLERFRGGVRDVTPLPAAIDDASAALSLHFGIDRNIVARALVLVAAGPTTHST